MVGALSIAYDRRRARRHKARFDARLRADLSLLDVSAGAGAEQGQLTLFGSTRDLSAAGLSLVVPSFSLDERFCAGGGRRLQVLLYLPSGPVEMRVAPVRCAPLAEREPRAGYFIGARITEMADDGRSRLDTYLGTLG